MVQFCRAEYVERMRSDGLWTSDGLYASAQLSFSRPIWPWTLKAYRDMRPSDLANGGEIADFYCGEYIADFSRENRGLFAQVKFMDGFDPDSRCLELKPLADFAKWNVSAKRHERAEEFDIDLGKFKGIGPVPEQLSAAV